MGSLDGKVALVTGAARGQGRSHALTLAREGADIVASDIAVPDIAGTPYPLATTSDLEETVAMVEAAGRRCVSAIADVRNAGDMRSVVELGMAELGRLDITVANAGVFQIGPQTWEITDEQWDLVIGVNLTGTWQTCRAAAPAMIEGGAGGSVTIISSSAGLVGFPGIAHYAAAKHAQVGLMRTLALELAPYSIRVNSLHPGGINTKLNDNEMVKAWKETHSELASTFAPPMPASLSEQDVSNTVAWLASGAARYITGVVIPIDAGWML